MSAETVGLPYNVVAKLNRVVMNRMSVRSYSDHHLTDDQCNQLDEFINQLNDTTTPFNSKCRFCLMRSDVSSMKTFGVIRGSKYWIYGVTNKKSEIAERQFGYLFEHLILKCTEMGLSTVWLSGMFKVSSYTQLGYNPDTEYIPCVSPLFFEHLRWAPTTTNSQKVRVIVVDDHIHFFMNKAGSFDIDAGIYIAHAEIYFKAHDIKFEIIPYEESQQIAKSNGWAYILSYKLN
ncbi:putative nitroreductase TM1586 domain-containing protein [Entamoeba marina]